jgi:hypothetical protein
LIWGVDDSTVLGLAGIIAVLLTAVISFWWNYKTRGMPHQEFLYQKQIEAYNSVSMRIGRITDACYDFLDAPNNVLTEDDRAKMRALFLELSRKHLLAGDWFLLPKGVVVAVNDLLRTLFRITATGTELDGRAMVEQQDPLTTLFDAQFKVYDTMRKEARIEPLTEHIHWAIGPEPRKREQA